MKVVKMAQDNVVIFLPKTSKVMDFSDKEHLEDQFKKLLYYLEEKYNIEIKGFYQIDIYEDPYYGIIVDMTEEDLPYFDYFENQIEMSIHIIKNAHLLYQVYDILDLDQEILSSSDFYQYQDYFFVYLKSKVSLKNYIRLLEYGILYYGKASLTVMNKGKKFSMNFS